ncbi:hypothetical protein Y868_08770, partial [Campylobacter jejuni CVM 41918]
FFFKQKTAYEIRLSLVGSEMCIRDRGYPARGVRTNLLNLVDKRMGPKINCISNCVAPCGRGKEATKVGYCIADRLFDAWSGKKETGLFFTGANGYRLDTVSYTHLRAHETKANLVCRLLLEKK